MNRFVYLVYGDYSDAAQHARAPGAAPRDLAEGLARLPAALMRCLADSEARVSGELTKNDPNVIQVTVVTALDEAATDAAFVRFIRYCSAGHLDVRAAARVRTAAERL
jgi:hypothetical protein